MDKSIVCGFFWATLYVRTITFNPNEITFDLYIFGRFILTQSVAKFIGHGQSSSRWRKMLQKWSVRPRMGAFLV